MGTLRACRWKAQHEREQGHQRHWLTREESFCRTFDASTTIVLPMVYEVEDPETDGQPVDGDKNDTVGQQLVRKGSKVMEHSRTESVDDCLFHGINIHLRQGITSRTIARCH